MTDTSTEPAQVTLPCPECGDSITGPESGRGSAPFKLASHRYRLHGVRSEGKRPKAARGRSPQTDDELAEHPVIGIVRDSRDQIPGGQAAPNATDLTHALGRALGLASTAVAGWAVETDELLEDSERDAIADELALTQRQAEDVMRPLGKAFSTTKLNKKYGRAVVENVDALASVAELGSLVMHWRRYFRQRSERRTAYYGVPPIDVPSAVIPDGGLPPPAGPGPGGSDVASRAPRTVQQASPAPQAGVVVTAEMITAAQNGRA